MVTTLIHKSFDRLSSTKKWGEDPSREPELVAIQILATMWLSFVIGAVVGAIMVYSFQSIGLFGMVLPYLLLIVFQMRNQSGPSQSEGA